MKILNFDDLHWAEEVFEAVDDTVEDEQENGT